MATIKESMEILQAVDVLASCVKAAKADGSLDWKDIPKFGPMIPASIKAIQDISKVKEELQDLDDQETKELLDKAMSSAINLINAIIAKQGE